MTQPQQDPVGTDPSSALARLAEQTIALQRQINQLRADMLSHMDSDRALTDAKFITFRTLIDSQAEQVKLALDASNTAISKQEIVTDRALTKQENATEKRFESVNEFRQQLNDQTKTFISRTEVEGAVGQFTVRLRELADLTATLMPRTESVALSERNAERIADLQTRVTKAEAAAQAAQASKAQIIAVISLVSAIIVTVVIVANALFK